MSAMTAETEERWERWLTYLPFPLLAVTGVIALATGSVTGATSPAERLVAQLVLMAFTGAWMWWFTAARPSRRDSVPLMRVHYVGRTVLAFGLTLLNPLFCVFAWVGYLDVERHFRGRQAVMACAATAVIMALGQSGGLPWENAGQGLLFVILLGVNFALAFTMSRWASRVVETSEERAEAITELERVNAQLAQAMAENAELHETVVAQAREAGVQEERQRLAREIHDGVAQALAGMLIQLQAAQEERDPRARIARSTELARAALTDARRSMMDLSPAPLSDHDLDDVLARLVDEWNAEHDGRAELVTTGTTRPLHAEVEATVLRIAQEALTNAGKHAVAGRVGVTLTYDDTEVMLDVRDDGIGFDLDLPTPATSFGLRGMRQRAERLAGVLEVEAEPGCGTAVSVRLPALARGAA